MAALLTAFKLTVMDSLWRMRVRSSRKQRIRDGTYLVDEEPSVKCIGEDSKAQADKELRLHPVTFSVATCQQR
jgi:hypothetical protein